jgi:ribonuclease Z
MSKSVYPNSPKERDVFLSHCLSRNIFRREYRIAAAMFFLLLSTDLYELLQVPTAERNVSGYTLTLSDGTHWLIDCGEGTQMQFGRARAALKGGNVVPPPLGGISRILITHLHGDHCYGLPGLLCSLSMARPRLAPPAVDTAPVGGDDDENDRLENFSATHEFLEILGPRGLAEFIRGALRSSDAHLAFKYRVGGGG